MCVWVCVGVCASLLYCVDACRRIRKGMKLTPKNRRTKIPDNGRPATQVSKERRVEPRKIAAGSERGQLLHVVHF